MTDPDEKERSGRDRRDDERRAAERRKGERREGERREETCPVCAGILNAKGYCYNCKSRVVKIR